MLEVNLLLETTALYLAVRSARRNFDLIAFLVYLVLFDVILGTAAHLHGATPFYAYWAGRSLGALLLMNLACGLWYRPRTGSAAALFLPAYWLGRLATTALGGVVLGVLWKRGLRSNEQALEAFYTLAAILLFQFAVAAFVNPQKRILAVCCALWPLVTLVFNLPVYPVTGLLPLGALCLYIFVQNRKERRIVTRHESRTGRTGFNGNTVVQTTAAAARYIPAASQWGAPGSVGDRT